MSSTMPGLVVSFKPGSPNEIKRLLPRGLRGLIVQEVHPDDMSQPCQQWLLKRGLIEPAKQQHIWKWTKLGKQVREDCRRLARA